MRAHRRACEVSVKRSRNCRQKGLVLDKRTEVGCTGDACGDRNAPADKGAGAVVIR